MICWRARRLRGSIPATALRITSSGRRSSISSRVRERIPPGIAAVAPVELVGALVAGDRDLLGVDDDDEVAGVAVRRVLGLALAAQGVGDLGRQPAEGLALGVDDVPVALAVGRVWQHRSSSHESRLEHARAGAAGRSSRAPAGGRPQRRTGPRSRGRRAHFSRSARQARLRRRWTAASGGGTMGRCRNRPAARKGRLVRMLPGRHRQARVAEIDLDRCARSGARAGAGVASAGAASAASAARTPYAHRRDLPRALRRRPRGDRGLEVQLSGSQPRGRRRGPLRRRRRRPGDDRADRGRPERDRGRGPGARRDRNGQGARLRHRGRDRAGGRSRSVDPGQIPEGGRFELTAAEAEPRAAFYDARAHAPGLLRLPAATGRPTSGSRSSTARPARSCAASIEPAAQPNTRQRRQVGRASQRRRHAGRRTATTGSRSARRRRRHRDDRRGSGFGYHRYRFPLDVPPHLRRRVRRRAAATRARTCSPRAGRRSSPPAAAGCRRSDVQSAAGNYVVIDGKGTEVDTMYAHMRRPLAAARRRPGAHRQVIGNVGQTATRPAVTCTSRSGRRRAGTRAATRCPPSAGCCAAGTPGAEPR